MNKPNNGGPAFPVAMNEISGAFCGMSLRAYMATKFMAAFLTTLPQAEDWNDPGLSKKMAHASAGMADDLIAELSREVK